MDKLRHLEIFATVASAGRFNLAAEQLGLSTSAVSHAIRSLEDHLGQVPGTLKFQGHNT